MSKLKPDSVFNMRKLVESKGFDIVQVLQKNGMYRVDVYRADVFLRSGKVDYKTWQEALETTEQDFYVKFTNK